MGKHYDWDFDWRWVSIMIGNSIGHSMSILIGISMGGLVEESIEAEATE